MGALYAVPKSMAKVPSSAVQPSISMDLWLCVPGLLRICSYRRVKLI